MNTSSSLWLASHRPIVQALSARPLPRIHVLSDLHLDSGPYALPANLDVDIVVAAGDIGPLKAAVDWLASLNKPVVYVLGNHERWGKDLDGAVQEAKALARGTQVRVLEREAVTIDGVRFLGATLWTDLLGGSASHARAVWHHMRDYRHIRCDQWLDKTTHRKALKQVCKQMQLSADLQTADDGGTLLHPGVTYLEHQRTVAWLKRALGQHRDVPTVVVTHHAPSLDSVRKNGVSEHYFKDGHWGFNDNGTARAAAYGSDLLDSLLLGTRLSQVALWVHGHTHTAMQYVKGGVHVVCNPRGHHEKPLTAESAESWRLFGVSFSEADIEASQARYRKNPWQGDAWGFEPGLQIDLLAPRLSVLQQACDLAQEALAPQIAELHHWVSGVANTRGLAREAVTQCVQHCLTRIQETWEAFLPKTWGIINHLNGRGVFEVLTAPRAPSLWSSKGFGTPYTVDDFRRALRAAEALPRALETLPQMYLSHWTRWAQAALKGLEVLYAQGLAAKVKAPGPAAFRALECRDLVFVCPAVEHLESEGLVDLEVALDKALNGRQLPRLWLTRLVSEGLGEQLLDKKALTSVATLPLASGPEGATHEDLQRLETEPADLGSGPSLGPEGVTIHPAFAGHQASSGSG